MISDLEGVSTITVAQQMYGAFEAPFSFGNSFLSHNYPPAILSTGVLLRFEKGNEKNEQSLLFHVPVL